MSLYVIDAAVAVKWFLPEPYSDKARTLLDAYNRGVDDLIAPDLLIPEVTNAFWKRAERADITTLEANANLSDLLALGIPLVSSLQLAAKALALTHAHKRSVYDCLYLALALDRGCNHISSDERLYNAVGAIFPQIRLLRDLQI